LKAVLTYTVTNGDKKEEVTRLFDTAKATKICDVKNSFGYKVQEIYITGKGVLFLHNVNEKSLEISDQKQLKKWIGENEPEKYIKYFGEVEEG
jgi:translation elongation factor P/translation initiation factor 5A